MGNPSRILLGAVGTADPMTELGDGPVLHIVRHYQPEEVVLAHTPDFLKIANDTAEAIQLVAPGTRVTLREFNLPPNQFVWIEPFRAIILGLSQQQPSDQLIANVSSGTPAMISALVALHAFGAPPLLGIQVSAPNGHAKREKFDTVLDNWEWNPDNLPGAPNRCHEIPSAHLSFLLQRENILSHIRAGDYHAAYSLVSGAGLPKDIAGEILTAYQIAALKATAGTDIQKAKLAVSAMQVAALAASYGYFLMLSEIAMTMIIRDKLRKMRRLRQVDQEILNPPIKRVIFLSDYLKHTEVENAFGEKQVDFFRSVLNARNDVAHSIQPVTENWLREKAGVTIPTILRKLETLAGVSPKRVTADNERIANAILHAEFQGE